MLVANTLDSLRRQVEEQDANLDTTNNLCQVKKKDQPPNDMLSSARFKKKEVLTKSDRRKKNWFEVKRKGNKKYKVKLYQKCKNQRYVVNYKIDHVLFLVPNSLEPFYFLLFIDTRWCANTSSSRKCLLGQQEGFRRISCRQFLHTTFNSNCFVY
jgi:hypothetical protein